MGTKKLLFLAVGVLLSIRVWSFDVTLANLYQYNPEGDSFKGRNITEDLFKSLKLTDEVGLLTISRIKDKSIPKSILDAAQLSETENRDYILYGFLKVTGNYYDFEVKLFDRKGGSIKTVFYAKNSISDYGDLITTMSNRIISYFYKSHGVKRRKSEAKKEYGVIDIETGMGYWFPFNPWGESLLGLVSFHVSSGLTPVDPLFTWDIFKFALEYGISLDYSPGMNRESFESYFLHSLRMGFPVTLSALWYYRNKIILQITPELQLDILLQDRLYGSMVGEKSAAFSLSGTLGYEYIFEGKRYSAGGEVRFHAAFYSSVLFTLEPALYVRYRFTRERRES